MKLTRRKFIIASIGIIATPAVIRVINLMPIRVLEPEWHHIVAHYKDGIPDSYIDGMRVTKGITRWTSKYILPDIEEFTFEAWVKDDNMDNIRITEGTHRYGF